MGYESSRKWSNIVYGVGIAVFLAGCADFLSSKAHAVWRPALMSLFLIIAGLMTTLVGFTMRKVVRDVESKNAEIYRALYELEKRKK